MLSQKAPSFVDNTLGLARTGEANIGALGPTYAVVGVLYLFGGLGFGIATVRAKVLPSWPAALLAITALLTPLAALLPHAIQRLAAVPMGVAFIGLGYALWSGTFVRHAMMPPR